MSYPSIALILTMASLVLTGCYTPYGTPDRTATGALLGAGVGAASGAVIGGKHAGEGALIGGAIGAITGSLIGHSMDARERARLQAEAPQTYERIDQGQPLQIADVKALANAGVSDDVIISQIQSTHTVYRLNATDIIDLRNAGVSDKVIQYMINTPSTTAAAAPRQQTTYVTQAPPPPVRETIVVAPGPGYYWVPGEWTWHGQWVWSRGYWAVPPRRHAVWIGGHWSHSTHGWHHSHGHWRY